MDIISHLEEGYFVSPSTQRNFSQLEWHRHATCEGVYLKHLVTSEETEGRFSYHLVRIDADKAIELHKHDTQLETHEVVRGTGKCLVEGREYVYQPGVIALLPEASMHEVRADSQGLMLLAKFIPALC